MNMFRTTKNPKKRWDSDVESEKANIWERKIHVIKAGSLYQIPRQIFVHCPFGNLTHKVILYTRTLRLNMALQLESGCFILKDIGSLCSDSGRCTSIIRWKDAWGKIEIYGTDWYISKNWIYQRQIPSKEINLHSLGKGSTTTKMWKSLVFYTPPLGWSFSHLTPFLPYLKPKKSSLVFNYLCWLSILSFGILNTPEKIW